MYIISAPAKELFKYFTVDAIVMDLALCIKQFRADHPSSKSKVITFGAKSGGTVAVYARRRFPDLIHGAWSSGGVFEFDVPNKAFLQTVGNLFKLWGKAWQCPTKLTIALNELKHLVETNNKERLVQLLNVCPHNNFSNQFDAQTLYETINTFIAAWIDTQQWVDKFIMSSQNFYHIPFSYYSYEGLRDICTSIVDMESPLAGLSVWLNRAFKTGNQCRDISNANVIANLRSHPFEFALDCKLAALSFFVTPIDGIFPNTVSADLYENRCRAIIGNE